MARLYLAGRNITSLAGYLATSRDRVCAVPRRWFAEGLPGLEDQSRAPRRHSLVAADQLPLFRRSDLALG